MESGRRGRGKGVYLYGLSARPEGRRELEYTIGQSPLPNDAWEIPTAIPLRGNPPLSLVWMELFAYER